MSFTVFTKRSVLNSRLCSRAASETCFISASCERMKLSAFTYSSTDAARKPTGHFSECSVSSEYSPFTSGYAGTMMSSLGPALLCATVTRPAAYLARLLDAYDHLHHADAEVLVPHGVDARETRCQVLLHPLVRRLARSSPPFPRSPRRPRCARFPGPRRCASVPRRVARPPRCDSRPPAQAARPQTGRLRVVVNKHAYRHRSTSAECTAASRGPSPDGTARSTARSAGARSRDPACGALRYRTADTRSRSLDEREKASGLSGWRHSERMWL